MVRRAVTISTIGLKKVKFCNIWVFPISKAAVQCVRGGGEGSGNIYFLKQKLTFLRINGTDYYRKSVQDLGVSTFLSGPYRCAWGGEEGSAKIYFPKPNIGKSYFLKPYGANMQKSRL